MGCRCRDMSNCSNDISKIGKIKELFSDTKHLNTSVSEELQKLANNCISTFYSINIFNLIIEEKKLNKDMITLLPNLVNKCEEKIENLHAEYRSMSSEDYDYHHRDDDDDD